MKDRDIDLLQHRNEVRDVTRSNDSKVFELELKDRDISRCNAVTKTV